MEHTRESVANALHLLGYTINRAWKFAAREERTPSAYIYKDGYIHDFGSGFHGDLGSFLEVHHNLCKREAFLEAKRLLNEPIEFDFSKHTKEFTTKSGFIAQKVVDGFKLERDRHFSRFKELLALTLPSLSEKQQLDIAMQYEIGYSKMADRLIMPIRNLEGRCITLWKYNPTPKEQISKYGELYAPPKVTFTKGQPRYPFNLSSLKRYAESKDEWILLCEGEKDCLNALGRGYRAITLGGVSERIKKRDIELFKGLNFVIVYDYDEAGHNGATALMEQLKDVAKEIKVWDWELLALQSNIKLYKGFDLTDFLCLNK